MSNIANKWFDENSTGVLNFVEDPQGLLTTDAGHVSGCYMASIVWNRYGERFEIPMYIGESIDVQSRLKEHCKRWLGKYTKYWTGITEFELINNIVKFRLELVGKEEDYEKRKLLETQTIMKEKPYLQICDYPKYSTKYTGADLAIIPFNDTRRHAFLADLNKRSVIRHIDADVC